MKRRDNPHSYEPRLQVLLESLAGEKTDAQIAERYGVAPKAVATWRNLFRERGAAFFELDTAFLMLIENACDVCTITDGDGVIRYASPSTERTFGHGSHELVGVSLYTLVHQDDVERMRNSVRSLRDDGGRSECYEVRILDREGSWRVCETRHTNLSSHPFVGGVATNLHDVSGRKRAEETLKRSEERYYKAFHSSPDATWISRLTDGRIIDINEGFERSTGYARAEVLGRTAAELDLWKKDEDRDETLRIIETEGKVRDREVELVNKQGYTITVLASAELAFIDNMACTLGTFRDITDRKQAEEVVRRTTDRLRQERQELAEKNIALNQVLLHLEGEKAAFRDELSSRVDNMLRPLVSKLKGRDDKLDANIERFEEELGGIVLENIDQFRHNSAKLSRRQWDICDLIRKGNTSKEIAEKLDLSLQTVHKHRQLIRQKLELNNESVNLAAYLRNQ